MFAYKTKILTVAALAFMAISNAAFAKVDAPAGFTPDNLTNTGSISASLTSDEAAKAPAPDKITYRSTVGYVHEFVVYCQPGKLKSSKSTIVTLAHAGKSFCAPNGKCYSSAVSTVQNLCGSPETGSQLSDNANR